MPDTLALVSVFAVFVPALLLPGPDFVAVVRAAMTGGARAGIATTAGTTIGLCLYATLSIFGLSALLVQFEWLTWLVRGIGGAYLIYLGVKLIRTPAASLEVEGSPPGRRWLLTGLVVNLTNPKAIVLFASVFATAITPQTSSATMTSMVALVAALTFTWYTLVSLFMASPPVMRRFARLKHWIERVAGACFMALGLKLIADARSPVAT